MGVISSQVVNLTDEQLHIVRFFSPAFRRYSIDFGVVGDRLRVLCGRDSPTGNFIPSSRKNPLKQIKENLGECSSPFQRTLVMNLGF